VHALALADDRVRVIATPPGGGFGGKEDYPSLIALHAALLAQACERPVRITYDRQEDIVATSKRHPSRVRHRSGVDADGRLVAMDIEIELDGGAHTTLSPVVLSRAALHATGPYRCPDVRIRGRALRTHTVPNGAFRGFGAPQVQFAAERQLDRIARAVGLTPLEVRLRNALAAGDALPTGQVLDESTSARRCLEEVARHTDFDAVWRRLERESAATGAESGARRRGIGLSLYFHGAGFTGNGEKRLGSTVVARLREDGRIELLTAAVDMGQGSDVLLPMLAADASGLTEDDLVLAAPDTARVPDSGPSVASRTSMIVGTEVALAAQALCREIAEAWAKRRGSAESPAIDGGVVVLPEESRPFRDIAREHFAASGAAEVTRRHEPPAWQIFDDATYQGAAYPTYAWGADVALVEVDLDTLQVQPLEVTAVCEVGRVLHPVLCRGQVEGGTLQGIGWALMEEIRMDRGRILNDRLATYILPTAQDCPALRVHLLEQPWSGGPAGGAGAKGVGELPMNGAAPAVIAAVESATGIAVDAIPATPERLHAWRERGQLLPPREEKA
jgi:CO/xanthine dehydrogenase Mo-binding subunit